MRTGNFSSSQIYRLMSSDRKGTGFGAPALTYIAEKRMERRLNRPLNSESNAKPTNWGSFVEKRAFDLLVLDYKLRSQDRLVHPDIDFWTGAPDCLLEDTVCDIKSPFTLKSFCETVDTFPSVEAFKDLRPEYYWQLLSNSILTGKKHCEIIVYVPYQSELEEIREMTRNFIGDQNKVAFINWAEDDQLPYLIEGGYYKNLNILRWEVSQEDKKLLTSRVIEAGKLLIKPL